MYKSLALGELLSDLGVATSQLMPQQPPDDPVLLNRDPEDPAPFPGIIHRRGDDHKDLDLPTLNINML